jgi:prevent-host-death family protein
MRSYPVAEAKKHFEEMLERVRAGETVALTDNGTTVAELHPKQIDRQALIDRLGKELAEIRAKVKPVTHDEIMDWRRVGLK